MANNKEATQTVEKAIKEEKVVKTEIKPDNKQEEIDFCVIKTQNFKMQ